MAHLDEDDLASAIGAMRRRGQIDARGVTFSGELQRAVTAAADGLATAHFDGAQFIDPVDFDGATFAAHAVFAHARFAENASFRGARFQGEADFRSALFEGDVTFARAEFGFAGFRGAQFSKNAAFPDVKAAGGVVFDQARFEGDWYGPLASGRQVSARGITVRQPIRLLLAAENLDLRGARFESAAVLHLRYAKVDLTDVVPRGPLTVVSHRDPLLYQTGPEAGEFFLEEDLIFAPEPWQDDALVVPADDRAAILSVTGTDAANLIFTDVDLSRCVFSGAYHLDRIRFEGCTFAVAPRGWRAGRAMPPLRRWTARKVLAEEQDWRSRQGNTPSRLAREAWLSPETVYAPLSATGLAVLYRQLRKSLEDAKDEPGAGDFYFGEMEARRRDRLTPWGERMLLHLYWLLAGYGLRATRAFGFLVAAMLATWLATMAFGLVDTSQNQQITGTVSAPDGRVSLTTATPPSRLDLPLAQRFTTTRAESAGQVVINSVVFRSSGQNLTPVGSWIEMVSRISEPALLAFALVAARGRIKR